MAVFLQHTKTSGKDELFSRDRDHWSYSNLAQKFRNTLKLSVNMVYDIPRSPAKFQRDRTSAANFQTRDILPRECNFHSDLL